MQSTTYRGYTIRYHRTGQWFAHILPPGVPRVMSQCPTATLAEGAAAVIHRAKAIIDAEEVRLAPLRRAASE